MTDDDGEITWRDLGLARVAEVVLGVLVALFVVPSIILQPGVWVAYPFLVAAVVVLAAVRRRATLTATELVAVGRFSRRRIALRDLTQVGRSLGGNVWVQTGDGRVTLLRMIPLVQGLGRGPKASPELVDLIRGRAAACGAQLAPLRDRPGVPRPHNALVFSI